MEEMKNVRLSQESIDILKRYGDSPNKGVLNLSMGVTNVTKEDFDNLKKAIDVLMSRMDTFMTHGQGGIRVYPMPVDRVDGKCVPRVLEDHEKGISRTDYPAVPASFSKNTDFRTAKQVKEG